MLETDIEKLSVSLLQSIVQQMTKAIMVRTRNGNVYHTASPAQPNVTGLNSNNLSKEWLTDDDDGTPMALFVVDECPVEVSSFPKREFANPHTIEPQIRGTQSDLEDQPERNHGK